MLAVRRLSMAVAEDRARFVFIIMVALVLRQRLADWQRGAGSEPSTWFTFQGVKY
jgi:hypothetical protein